MHFTSNGASALGDNALHHQPQAQTRAWARRAGQSEHRIDAHPVWDRTGRMVVFNGVHNDTRSVFVADVGPWLEGQSTRSPTRSRS
jgi:hypothetical protein